MNTVRRTMLVYRKRGGTSDTGGVLMFGESPIIVFRKEFHGPRLGGIWHPSMVLDQRLGLPRLNGGHREAARQAALTLVDGGSEVPQISDLMTGKWRLNGRRPGLVCRREQRRRQS